MKFFINEYFCLFVCLFLKVPYLAMTVQLAPHETTVSNVKNNPKNKNATSKLISTQCSRLVLIDFLVVMRPDITKKMGGKMMFPCLLVI